ncbi:MAG: T9SS type A sorting domain-containing protein [candidate division Zixibacteria bacterium]|nr:T9SS type A sorting domain-containing protein [candidate division Zixibacteria bacterium]
MQLNNKFVITLATCAIMLSSNSSADTTGKIWYGEKRRDPDKCAEAIVQHHSLAQPRNTNTASPLDRKHPWSLPDHALDDDFDTTINILVLRFDFQYEEVDDPNTTGRGVINLNNPIIDPVDSAIYYDTVGHWIDPPPHNSAYFDAHLCALQKYWETVSKGRYSIKWDIFPPGNDSTYKLPLPMSEYGICHLGLPAEKAFDTVLFGLIRYFKDGIRLADEMSPEIDFSQYGAFFLFHAGSDRQNDIGFPMTCSDLFTGYINYIPEAPDYDTVWVDDSTKYIENALLLPETTNQDNRSTAMNAVIAHEFGHQLGLVDLYRTDNFVSCIGDFALMDNNGFGTTIDFNFNTGGTFGTMPIYPSAWSRAFLGFVEVHDFRQGTEIKIAAAEIVSEGIQVARVPISETEYYLIENRVVDLYPEITTAMLADSVTNVIQYPVDQATREFTGEYDFLLPGSGLLIYHVDEGVAVLDYDGDGQNNFDDNQLQLDPSRRRLFVSVVEADGITDMSGYGVGSRKKGWEGDMFREDRNRSFTPNTNPAAIDNSGNNTHVRVTDIHRQREEGSGRIDTAIFFDLETRGLLDGFPVRTGFPFPHDQSSYAFSPIIDDIDRDGSMEIIVASFDKLSVVTAEGGNFLHEVTGCDPCSTHTDSAWGNVHYGRSYPVPLYMRTPNSSTTITTNPVTGDFGVTDSDKLVAVGYDHEVNLYETTYDENLGQADTACERVETIGTPRAISFGKRLYVLDDLGKVYLKTSLDETPVTLGTFTEDEYHGICRIGEALVLLAGDSLSEAGSSETKLHYITTDESESYTLTGYYSLGPIVVDINRDSLPEIIVFSPDGDGVYVTIDTTNAVPHFSILTEKQTGVNFSVNPVAGDVDSDGYPDIVICGATGVYSYNSELTVNTGFPIEIDDRPHYAEHIDDDPDLSYAYFYQDFAISPAVIADIEKGGMPEIVFPTFAGNIASYGPEVSAGFPLSGGERGTGSPVIFFDNVTVLAFLGADGWFYAWEVSLDSSAAFWPMGGHDASGSYAFDQSSLAVRKQFSNLFPDEKFYNYPNPVINGSTTIRYFLGQEAKSVNMTIYDLSGREIISLPGPTTGGVNNEKIWNCGSVTPGVYRCMIEVDFGTKTESAFTDIAVIR